MFTGLIEAVGRVAGIERRGEAAGLAITVPFPAGEVSLGDSVAVNGVCLTMVEKRGNALLFDVSPETIERSSLKGLKTGSLVNLERALRLSDRLGGHIVTGHVDCIAAISDRRDTSGNIIFTFRIPREFMRHVAPKGSVTIDGISLTVNTVADDGFTVNVIPHTARLTTLQGKRPGDEVNIETDLIAKYLERLLSAREAQKGEGITFDLLAKNGFL